MPESQPPVEENAEEREPPEPARPRAMTTASYKQGYETLDWKGHPLYKCAGCPFRSFYLDEIEKHLATAD